MKALNVLITGGAHGIGYGLSRLFVRKGHKVFMIDNRIPELLNATKQISTYLPCPAGSNLIEKDDDEGAHTITSQDEQGNIFGILSSSKADLRKREDIKSIAELASKFFNGRMDVLIHNAAYTNAVGGASIDPSQDKEDEFTKAWDALIETNLTAPALLTRACIPMLQRSDSTNEQAVEDDENRQGGCVIHISSTRAYQSEPDSEAYAATKGGLLGLNQSLAVSLAPLGISVNALVLGWINVQNEDTNPESKTERWTDGLSREDHGWHLTGRVGRVEDVMKAVEYLIDAKGFVTGSEITIDGGVTRKMVYPE